MKSTQQLLAIRKERKEHQPLFIRQDAYKKKRLSDKWTKPKGMHSKLRRSKRGRGALVKVGYGTPQAVRGLSREGLKVVSVSSLNDLQKVGKEAGAMLSSTLGEKKKLTVLKACVEHHIKVLNVKDPAAYLKAAEHKLAVKKKSHEEQQKTKEDKKKVLEQKASEKKKEGSIEKKIEDEEKKAVEKEEKDKVLTHK
ncbi:hypothetical protein HZB02_04735 [Candidatus Woesearchaeota archaeon]|nr:hypothetical protein [Candidatus Woesearchaeota archaeon]